MITHYLKIAFRNMWKYKTQTIFNIMGLVVGFACFVFWMTLNNDIGRSSGFPGMKRSYHVHTPRPKDIPFQIAEQVSQQIPQIEHAAWFKYPRREYLSTSDDLVSPRYHAEVMPVSHQYFRFFSIDFIAGHIPASMEKGLVIDIKYAQKMFGNESPLGRTVYINHETWTIFGLINSQDTGMPWWADFYLLNDPALTKGNVRFMVKLYENASISDFRERIGKIETVKPDGTISFLYAYSMDTTGQVVGVVFVKLITLLIGSLLLIVALFNYISFTLSRFYRRTKECGIRIVNGSSASNLFMLFFTEVLIAMLLAGIISFPLCGFMINLYNETNLDQIELNRAVGNFIFYFAWSVALALLMCLPVVGRIERMGTLSAIASKPTSGKRLFFIGVQMFISVAMIIFSSWMYFQINQFFSAAYPGLSKQEKREIVMMNPEILRVIDRDLPERVIREVLSDADVIAATRFNSYSRFVVHPVEQMPNIAANVFHVDGQYADFLKVRMLEGRFPRSGEPGVVAIDQNLAKLLGGENLVGQTIEIEGESNIYAICGICERIPVHIHAGRDGNPSCFISGGEDLLQEVYLKINPHNFEGAVADLRQQTEKYSKIIPAFTIKTLKEKITDAMAGVAKVSGIITGIALLLSMFGVYSSIAMDAESRRREVAIRKVNGAEEWNIFVLFGKSYLIALVIAWMFASFLIMAVTLLMSKGIETSKKYILGVDFFLIVLVVMVLITVATIFNKVWSISKINPAEVIKSE